MTLWLTATQGLRRSRLWIDRHYTHIGREIAGVSIMSPPELRERLTEAARQAFLALGYTIENTGADLYHHATCDGRHSRHETIKAYARIEAALRRWPST
ncbi:hypothetical protein [Paracoccus seriniphilus]|uniref:hypothetical protein n=1 Tax=Paracoccus seriniphilus TaxID=184748 RepID=UPI003567B3F0